MSKYLIVDPKRIQLMNKPKRRHSKQPKIQKESVKVWKCPKQGR